jgi:hypothetical protein
MADAGTAVVAEEDYGGWGREWGREEREECCEDVKPGGVFVVNEEGG